MLYYIRSSIYVSKITHSIHKPTFFHNIQIYCCYLWILFSILIFKFLDKKNLIIVRFFLIEKRITNKYHHNFQKPIYLFLQNFWQLVGNYLYFWEKNIFFQIWFLRIKIRFFSNFLWLVFIFIFIFFQIQYKWTEDFLSCFQWIMKNNICILKKNWN